MSESSEEPKEDTNSDEDQESDEEYESESEEVSRESAKVLFEQSSEAVEEMIRELRQVIVEIDTNSEAYVEVDAADSTYTSSGSDEGSAEDSVDEVESLRRRVREYRQDEIGTQNRKGRFFARSKGIMVILAFASTISAIATVIVAILEAVRTSNKSNSSITPVATGTDGLTDSQRKLILSQVMLWRGLDEKTSWAMLSKYCDSFNPSWQAQILIMDTIKRLAAPLNPGWVWRGSDAAKYARALVAAFNGFVPATSQKRSRILYDAVATMTYDRFKDGHLVKLPRQIAADLVELAITELVLGAPSRAISHE